MNNGLKRYPIGTVVLLKNGTKRVMIDGYYSISEEENKIYDYSGVLYPEGLLNTKNILLFDQNQIVKVYHLGLIDNEEKSFQIQLDNVVNQKNNN